MKDFSEINRMTLYEYEMRMTAYRLQQADREYNIHLLAWESWNVQAMKKQGKHKRVPVFGTFKQFYDYEGRVKDILSGNSEKTNLPDKKRKLARLLKKQKERRLNNAEPERAGGIERSR